MHPIYIKILKGFMKKLILFFVTVFVVASCSLEDDSPKFHVEFVPIVNVHMPEAFYRGETYEIQVEYKRPSDCYFFDGFYYEEQTGALLVAVQTLVIEDAQCQPLDTLEPEVASFNFTCSPGYTEQAYVFKFYTGNGQMGTDNFTTWEVPVIQ